MSGRRRKLLAAVAIATFLVAMPGLASAGRMEGLGDASVSYDPNSLACRDGIVLTLSSVYPWSTQTYGIQLRSASGVEIYEGKVPLTIRDLTAEASGRGHPIQPTSATVTFRYGQDLAVGDAVELRDPNFANDAPRTFPVQDCRLEEEQLPDRPGRPHVEAVDPAVFGELSCEQQDERFCPVTQAARVSFQLPPETARLYHAYVYTPSSPYKAVYTVASTPNTPGGGGGVDNMLVLNLGQLTGAGEGPYRVRIAVENAVGEGERSAFSRWFYLEQQ